MKANIGEAGAGQQRLQALSRVEPLCIELIGDDAPLGVDHDLAADQPIAVLSEVTFATDEMILVNPFPRTRIEVTTHPLAIHQIHNKRPAGGEGTFDRFEHGEIVFLTLEVAKRVAEKADAMKLGVAKAKASRVTFVERDLKVALLGAFASEADQIARAVESGDVRKASPGKLQRMAALATAQIKDAVIALEPNRADQKVDLFAGVAIVLNHVAVGFEIERVEQGAPPIRG